MVSRFYLAADAEVYYPKPEGGWSYWAGLTVGEKEVLLDAEDCQRLGEYLIELAKVMRAEGGDRPDQV